MAKSTTTWSVPSEEDYTALARKWLAVVNLIREEYGFELDQTESSLNYLQRIIDDELVDPKNRYALDCLGVVFGRIIAHNNPSLDWWIVEDQYGRDPVLRYKQTSLRLSAISTISTRIEDNEPFNLRSLYGALIETVNRAVAKGDMV